jgi:hypothetical protein
MEKDKPLADPNKSVSQLRENVSIEDLKCMYCGSGNCYDFWFDANNNQKAVIYQRGNNFCCRDCWKFSKSLDKIFEGFFHKLIINRIKIKRWIAKFK